MLVFCARFWTLDPIDGTKGFLRGGQYAISLAFLVDVRVELGVIGCPNLPTEPYLLPQNQTTMMTSRSTHKVEARCSSPSAGKAHTSSHSTLPPPHQGFCSLRRLTMHRLALHDLSFLESYEKAHAALDTNALVASRLGVRAQPIRMNSQAKYAALVRADGGRRCLPRLPIAFGKNGDDGEGGYQGKIYVRLFSLSLSPQSLFAKTKNLLE